MSQPGMAHFFFWGEDAPEDYLSGHMLSCSKTCATVLDKNCLILASWMVIDGRVNTYDRQPSKKKLLQAGSQ